MVDISVKVKAINVFNHATCKKVKPLKSITFLNLNDWEWTVYVSMLTYIYTGLFQRHCIIRVPNDSVSNTWGKAHYEWAFRICM